MARKKKTPPFIAELLERHLARMNWIDELIRVKTTVPVENQAEHVKSKGLDYFEGLAVGANAALEDLLHTYGCYRGFHYVGPGVKNADGLLDNPWISHTHADFVDWRRVYHVSGV